MITKKKVQNNSGLEVNWALLCKSASVDKQTNSASLFNVIDELTINKGPLGGSMVKKTSSFSTKTQIPTDLTLVVQMTRDPEIEIQKYNPEMKLRVVSPEGDNFAETDILLKYEEGKNRLRAIVTMGVFPVKNSGLYKIVVSTRSSSKYDFEEGFVVPVEVKIYE